VCSSDLSLKLTASGNWNMNSGRVEISEYQLEAAAVGSISISGAIGGYTESFAKQMRSLSAFSPDADFKQRQIPGMQIFAMMSGLTFENLTIKYNDASLANRMLDSQAQIRGITRDELTKNLSSTLPMVAAPLQNPQFIGMLTKKVSSFLASPGNFSISATPDQPMPIASILAAGARSPHTLIDTLNVVVKANQ